MTAFPLARSITAPSEGVNGRTAQAFVETSAQSWAEKDLGGLVSGQQVTLDAAAGDKQGPIALGAAVSAAATDAPAPPAPAEGQAAPPTPETRVVVVGDSDFAANYGLGIQGNRDLFMNAVNWLAQQEGPHRRAAARPGGSPADDDGRPVEPRLADFDLHHPGAHLRRRCLHLVAEEIASDAGRLVHSGARRGRCRPRRLHLLRRFGAAGDRGQGQGLRGASRRHRGDSRHRQGRDVAPAQDRRHLEAGRADRHRRRTRTRSRRW